MNKQYVGEVTVSSPKVMFYKKTVSRFLAIFALISSIWFLIFQSPIMLPFVGFIGMICSLFLDMSHRMDLTNYILVDLMKRVDDSELCENSSDIFIEESPLQKEELK